MVKHLSLTRSLVLAPVAGLLLLACAPNPSVEENLKKFLPAYCDKLQTCFADAYTGAYPAGQKECVDKGINGISADTRKKESACSDGEISTCVNDVKALACPADVTLDSSALPASCKKC